MIYLDNAATSCPKPEIVYKEIERCMRSYCANPGRGGHVLSNTAGEAVMRAREIICDFFNCKNPLRICFTKNATEALNIGIKGCLMPEDHVITTCMEHNSVIRPLKTLERDVGIKVSVAKGNEYGEITVEDIKSLVQSNTKLIVCTLSSNVNGIIMPVKEIGKFARQAGILYLVDASQGAGSIKIDVHDMSIDMLAFPGHKGLLGPQGIGGLYLREGIRLNPLFQGGTGSNSENMYQPDFMPDMLESGTLNTPGIVGMGCGIEFINSFGIDNIRIYKHLLIKRFFDGISGISSIKVYSRNGMEENSGILALNIGEMDSNEVSYILDRKYRIATRAGVHCAPLAHKTLGTLGRGIVRFSVSCFNTINEIDAAVDAVREIARSCV